MGAGSGLTETTPHAGHADIPRGQVDGAVGMDAEAMARKGPSTEDGYTEIELVAKAISENPMYT
ncbi:hypothetical protein JOD54_004085 [Actinokineospora baliensis]|uniref:hypothetical protein n=1 Tax=Actinokineospora baliensis TaxID=547056 RepID=UPI00195D3EFE|nr:hypothetical protein [Actinokineospora baliensis]MBM7773881.1 hypothetical protein [Actinokineospora baliensis]